MKLYLPVAFLCCSLSVSALAQDLPVTRQLKILADYTPLDELNEAGMAECYPFLSPDALHMYYTKSTDNYDEIHFASRASLDEPFKDQGVILSTGISADHLSCWVSLNELEMYYIARVSTDDMLTTLYRATRRSTSEPFRGAEKVILKGTDLAGCLFAPSFSPDKSELFLANRVRGNSSLQFVHTGNNEYTLKQRILIDEGTKTAIGQLSIDGLRYYTVFEEEENEQRTYRLGYYERAKLGADFTHVVWIGEPTTQMVSQLCEALDGQLIMHTIPSKDSWEGNDLAFTQIECREDCDGDKDEQDMLVETAWTISPNPATAVVNLGSNTEYNGVRVVDMTGKTIMSEKGMLRELNVEGLMPGNYLILFEKDGTVLHRGTMTKL